MVGSSGGSHRVSAVPTAIVTDSTAMLSAEVAGQRGITVVPLQVIIGPDVFDDGSPEVSPEAIAAALKEFRPVSTSRPAPDVVADVYRRLADAGATEIVSIHLSSQMSGTYESAQLAAQRSPIPVHPVDSGQVGVATAYAVLSAADVVDRGGTATEAVAAARQRARASSSLFYVDTLEYLRRGGRIGAAAAILGGALAVKPLLTITDGRVATLEKVRTSGRALARLEELAVDAAGQREIDLCVAHLASEERARHLAERLGSRLATNLGGRETWVTELGAVLGAHVGPGMVAVCVAPRPA